MTPERIARYQDIMQRCNLLGYNSLAAVVAELVEEVLAKEQQIAELRGMLPSMRSNADAPPPEG